MIALQNLLKRFVKAGLNFLDDHPKLRFCAGTVAHTLGLKKVTRWGRSRFSPDAYGSAGSLSRFIAKDAHQLSPRTRQIYAGMKTADHHQKGNR